MFTFGHPLTTHHSIIQRLVVPLDSPRRTGRSALDLFAAVREEDHAFFLDSAALGSNGIGPTGRYSFFGGRPHLIVRSRGLKIEIQERTRRGGSPPAGRSALRRVRRGGCPPPSPAQQIEFGNPLQLVRTLLRSMAVSPLPPVHSRRGRMEGAPPQAGKGSIRPVPVGRMGSAPTFGGSPAFAEAPAGDPFGPSRPHPSLLPFAGGFVGYLAYDLAHFFERLPCTTEDDLRLPDLYLTLPGYVVVVDQVADEAHLVAIGLGETEKEAEQNAGECCEEMTERLERAPRLVSLTPVLRTPPLQAWRGGRGVRKNSVELTSDFTREEYEEAVLRVKQYVAAGDIIQANIAQRLQAPFTGDHFALYCALRRINPSPFAFYFNFEGVTLASCSPERLLEVRGDRIQTRPIAGTRPRGQTDEEDAQMRAELLLSEKERAEHIMLVDLERNDLGRICRYGTVRVDELMTVEQYSHVFHIVSNVSGRLRPGRDAIDAIAACFPGGTITGAPKIRCMEIIDEIERHRRGPYTGSAGYISFEGEMDLNIIIRTFILTQGKAYIHVGGGIVADSEPAREYEETLHKARALVEALETTGST